MNAMSLIGAFCLLAFVTIETASRWDEYPRMRWVWLVIAVLLYLGFLHSLYQAAHGQKVT